MTDLEQFITACEAHAVPDDEIDFSDIPELTGDQITQIRPSHLVNKAMWKPHNRVLSIRIDADFLEAIFPRRATEHRFKSGGELIRIFVPGQCGNVRD